MTGVAFEGFDGRTDGKDRTSNYKQKRPNWHWGVPSNDDDDDEDDGACMNRQNTMQRRIVSSRSCGTIAVLSVGRAQETLGWVNRQNNKVSDRRRRRGTSSHALKRHYSSDTANPPARPSISTLSCLSSVSCSSTSPREDERNEPSTRPPRNTGWS